MNRLKLIIYFLAAFLLASSIGLNAVVIPSFMEENTVLFSSFSTTIILSTETAIAIVICFFMISIIRKLGLKKALVIAILLRVIALLGMGILANTFSWLVLSTFVGVGTFFCLMTIQLCINYVEIKKFKGLIYALFGTIISLGIATGPIIYSSRMNLAAYLPFFPESIWQHTESISFCIGAIITLLFAVPLFIHRDFIPQINKITSFSIPHFIKDNQGVLFAVALCGISFFGVSWYITVYGIRNELSLLDSSLLLTAFMLGSVCLDTPISTLSEYFDRRFVLVYSALVCTILAIFLPLAIYQAYQAYALLFVWGGLISGMYSNCLILLEKKYGTDNALAGSTVFSFMENLGATGGLILIGFMVNLIGTDGFSYVIIFSNLIYFSFVLINYKENS